MEVKQFKSFTICTFLLGAMLFCSAIPAQAEPMRLAQNGKGKKAEADTGKAGGRKKFLSSEARSKGTKTNIDFDDAAIDGERRIPAGVAIGGAKQEHEYDLINLRLRWHPEMIKSTSNLETGKSQ